jgi:hypothetical protein
MPIYTLDTTSRWVHRKTSTGDNAMVEALALGICLTNRLRLGKKFAVPWSNSTMRSCLTRAVQEHLEEYQALAGPNQEHSITAERIAPSLLGPLSIEGCARLAINDCSGANAPITIDTMTARLGLRRIREGPPQGRRIAYNESIVIGTSLPTITPSSPFNIAIMVGATGQCALFTRGPQLRQACEGLVKLLPRKCITHSEARALLHPVRARNPPPPGPERITGFTHSHYTNRYRPNCRARPPYPSMPHPGQSTAPDSCCPWHRALVPI